MKMERIAPLREILARERSAGETISFVPTMGALHGGHKSCIQIARKECDILVVSIYVNPTQFGPNEDYEKYPRALEKDLEMCERMGCDIVFTPRGDEMYPVDQKAWVTIEDFSEPLCGRKRKDHFRGVATIVAKLINIVNPNVVVFGQKDAQQAVVIREMIHQLNFPVRMMLSPTVREPDGLAVSSRNAYLSANERKRAAGLYKSLCAGRMLLERGERDPDTVTGAVRDHLIELGIDDVEYVELLEAEKLTPLRRVEGKILLALAVKIGATRLIDNLVLIVSDDEKVRESLLF